MSRSRAELDQAFYDMIEGRIVGSLKTCDGRRIYIANIEEGADKLLGMFRKKRDLGINARSHIVRVLSTSKRVIVEEEGAVMTLRLPTRREADQRQRQFRRQTRTRIDSRHTRARRSSMAAG